MSYTKFSHLQSITNHLEKCYLIYSLCNPLRPDISTPHCSPYIFSYGTDWYNLFKHQDSSSLVIILSILITCMFDQEEILLGEIRFWLLLGLKEWIQLLLNVTEMIDKIIIIIKLLMSCFFSFMQALLIRDSTWLDLLYNLSFFFFRHHWA